MFESRDFRTKKTAGAKVVSSLICAIMILSLVFSLMPAQVQAASGTIKSITVSNVPDKTLTIAKGKTFTLKVKVNKTGSISTKVSYSSSNKKAVTVNSKGVLKGIAAGTSKITITSKANKKKKVVLTVKVGTPVTKVALNKTVATIKAGKSLKLKATVSPTKATNKALKWTSSNSKIATVTSKGVVKGVKKGTAKITVRAKDGSGKKAVCTVTVGIPVTKVALNKTKANLVVGKTLTLKATATPANATNKAVKWTSSNSKVATVTSKGVVKALKAGTAQITASAKDGTGKKAVCTVTVKNPVVAVSSVTLNQTTASLEVNKTLTLKATVTPANASNKTVQWTSSNSSVATVTSNGVVKAIKAGTVKITASAKDGCTGEFELEINGYEQVPHDIQQKLADEYQEKRAAGER